MASLSKINVMTETLSMGMVAVALVLLNKALTAQEEIQLPNQIALRFVETERILESMLAMMVI
jgi:hypothetical protein